MSGALISVRLPRPSASCPLGLRSRPRCTRGTLDLRTQAAELDVPAQLVDTYTLAMGFLGFTPQEQRALVLSTFAGLSTTIGALFAVRS